MGLGLGLRLGLGGAGVLGPALDPDAAAYIAAVETADGEPLEEGVKLAWDEFFKYLKSTQDGGEIWSKINLLGWLGQRTLAAALIHIKGPSNLINNGVVSGQLNRLTGVSGSGASDFDTNYSNLTDGQDDHHRAIYATSLQDSGFGHVFSKSDEQDSVIFWNANANQVSFLSATTTANSFAHSPTKSFIGFSRNNATNYIARLNNSTSTVSRDSNSWTGNNLFILSRGEVSFLSSGTRILSYSAGGAIGDTGLQKLRNAWITLETNITQALL